MALTKKIKKAAYDKLPDELKKLYIAGSNDDEYLLDVEGGEEDAGALRRALERERTIGGDNKKRIKELEDQLASITDADARKKGDIETLEKGWKKRQDDTEAAYNARIAKLTSSISKSMIDGAALSMASKISNTPNILLPHIKGRLQVVFENDEPKLVVLGGDGKPTDLTVEKLQEEFVANKDFSSIIIGSKATGGSTAKGSQKQTITGGAGNAGEEKPDLTKIAPGDFAARIQAKFDERKTNNT